MVMAVCNLEIGHLKMTVFLSYPQPVSELEQSSRPFAAELYAPSGAGEGARD